MAYTDRMLEEAWETLTDIPMYEDEELNLRLYEPWFVFDKDTDRETIWKWFDEQHSKGVAWLLYDYEMET